MVLKEVCIVKFNKPNQNGRVYSSKCFNLDDPVIQEKLKNNSFFGELGFPEGIREEVDLSKVSHVIKNLYKKEDGLYADIETLDTPNGRKLEQVASKHNFRTRGVGNLIPRDDGYYEVTDYTLQAIDYTDDPA